jgi:hypothetical protein
MQEAAEELLSRDVILIATKDLLLRSSENKPGAPGSPVFG